MGHNSRGSVNVPHLHLWPVGPLKYKLWTKFQKLGHFKICDRCKCSLDNTKAEQREEKHVG
jgi:hypothetical protein